MKTKSNFIIILISMLSLCSIIQIPLYFMIVKEYKDSIRERMIANAVAASMSYDGDLLESINQQNQSERKKEIKVIQDTSLKIEQAHDDIQFVYTMRLNPKKEVEFLVDAVSLDRNGDGKIAPDEEAAPIGEVYKNPPAELLQAFVRPSCDKEANTDRWGTFISGYAPIKNSKNQIIAIVGLDMKINIFKHKMDILNLSTIISMIVAITLSLLLSFFLDRKIRNDDSN